MLSREFGAGAAESAGAPPPLHVYDPDCIAANWHPVERPYIRPTPPGPTLVRIPVPAGAELGDDPTNPAAQTRPRARTLGMIGWLDADGKILR